MTTLSQFPSDVKSLQAALRESEERYRLLVDSVHEYAIFTMDLDGHITTWNPGAERLCGYTEAEAIGQRCDIIFTPEDRAAGAPAQERETARCQGQALDERWHLRKDGSRFWGSGVMTALRDESGRLRGLAKVLRDYTERKQLEEQLQTLNAHLEARIEERTAQLRAVAGEVVLAEQKERERIAQLLHDDLQQLLFALKAQLGLYQLEQPASPNTAPSPAWQDLQALLTQTIELTRQLTVELSPPVLQSQGLVEMLRWLASHMQQMYGLAVAVESQAQPRLASVELRILLFQLVRELLFNVVKHAGVKQAQVEVTSTGPHLVIRVRDPGRGFALAPSGRAQGYGLRSIQERLALFHGQLELISQPGVGTQATIRIPFQPAEPLPHGSGTR